jgi:hypothetical protein
VNKPPLAFDDAFELLGPALPGDAVVLVGGQAINYWLSRYRSREPSLEQLALVTSDDVDFCGTQDDALRMARAIAGSSVKMVGVEARAAATAIVAFTDTQGVERQIDFLRTVHGLDVQTIRETAIEVELVDRDDKPTGILLRVLHPVLCLVSRFHNTHSFPKYQEARGLRQARAAIGIAKGFLKDLCDAGKIRDAHRSINVIGELACCPEGRAVFELFQLDAFEAIPDDPRLGGAFFKERLPRLRSSAGRP